MTHHNQYIQGYSTDHLGECLNVHVLDLKRLAVVVGAVSLARSSLVPHSLASDGPRPGTNPVPEDGADRAGAPEWG